VEKTANVPHITLSALVKSLKVTSDDSYDAETDINLLNRLRKLEGTILDGECLISQQQIDAIVAAGETTGGLSKFCTSIMGSLPGEAVQKQLERGFMRWVIFDCLAYKGKDLRAMPQMERRMYAAKAVEEWGNPYVSMAPMASQNKRAFLQEILARPFGEGIIAKHIAATYGDKKRWIKNKLLENHDCVIMGYEAPKKESEKTDGTVSVTKFHANGWIGAVVIGQYLDGKLTPMGTISGMDESIRIMLSGPKGKAHIGRVVEIECNGREPTLAFRHPRFNGFRDDKQATDCVYYAEET
jgi:ATP-dependent DNA ligase